MPLIKLKKLELDVCTFQSALFFKDSVENYLKNMAKLASPQNIGKRSRGGPQWTQHGLELIGNLPEILKSA